jgi:TonB family protein
MPVRIVTPLLVVLSLSLTAALAQQSTSGVTNPGPVERQAKAITPQNPVPPRLATVIPSFPAEALAGSATAIVSVRVTVDEAGAIAEARTVGVSVNLNVTGSRLQDLANGAPPPDADEQRELSEAFARASVDAVRRWQYEPPVDGPIAFNVRFEFSRGGDTRLVADGSGQPDAAEPAAGIAREAERGTSPVPASPLSGTEPGSITEPPRPDAVRVGGNIRPPEQIRRVNPVYPPEAQQTRVQGVIILETLIGTNGRVADIRVLRSIPLLDQAAIDAVRRWEYAPTLLNGVPVPVIMTVTVQFTLTE